jgi:hypothetical protein
VNLACKAIMDAAPEKGSIKKLREVIQHVRLLFILLQKQANSYILIDSQFLP